MSQPAKTAQYFSLTGILSGVPAGTSKPTGKYVYQKTKAGLGNIPGDTTRRHQVRVWTAGTNPQTPAQQTNRSEFRRGVAAWHTLDLVSRETLRRPAEKLHLNNFQLFMRQWMRGIQPLLTPIWEDDETMLTVIAGADIGGHRAIVLDDFAEAQYASNETAAHALIQIGVTTGAASMGNQISAQTFGIMDEPSWAWTLDQPIYLGTNGLLTQVVPEPPALFQRIIAFPITATRVMLIPRDPIFIL